MYFGNEGEIYDITKTFEKLNTAQKMQPEEVKKNRIPTDY